MRKVPFALEVHDVTVVPVGVETVMSAAIGRGGQGLSARSTGQSGPNSTVPSTPLALPE
jgi:hypothetical protein